MGFFTKILGKLVEEKRIEEELEVIDEVIRSNPENPVGWRIKGGILYQLRRYEESIEAHTEVLTRDPEYVDAWKFKGLAFYQLKQYHEAVEMFDEVLNRDPDNREIRSLRDHIVSLREYVENLGPGQRGSISMENR